MAQKLMLFTAFRPQRAANEPGVTLLGGAGGPTGITGGTQGRPGGIPVAMQGCPGVAQGRPRGVQGLSQGRPGYPRRVQGEPNENPEGVRGTKRSTGRTK